MACPTRTAARVGEAPAVGMAMMQRMKRELARINEELANEVV